MTTETLEPASVPSSGRDWRKLALVQLVLLLVVAFVWLVWQLVVPISHTVTLFLLGIAFAFVLNDPANYLGRRLGGRHSLGIALAYLIALFIVCGALLLLAAPVVQELKVLDANLPAYLAQLQSQSTAADATAHNLGVQLGLSDGVAESGPAAQASLSTALNDAVALVSAIGSVLGNAVLILVVSVYVLTGAPAIQHNVQRAVPRRYRGVHRFMQSSAARIMGAYLRGQLIMALVIGTLAAVGTWFLGLPYFLVLGVLAGMFEMVPMFGPILSAIPAVFVALFQPWPTVIWVILYFVIIQQFECNFLGPRVTGHKVGLHPLGAMFALMVGFELAGILGGLFAVPVAGVLWVFVSTAYVHIVGADQLAEEEVGAPPLLEPADGTLPAV